MQDDGAPCHQSKPLTKFVRDLDWNTLDWPPLSPDLNSIENLWSVLKKKVWTKHFASTVELEAKMISIWHNDIEQDLLEKLAPSMSDCLSAVIKYHGVSTKYQQVSQ